RDAEAEQRDHRAAHPGVVRRLGTGDAFDGSVAEFLFPLRDPLLHDVGHEGCQRRPDAGQDADDEAEHRTACPGPGRALPVVSRHTPVVAEALDSILRCAPVRVVWGWYG